MCWQIFFRTFLECSAESEIEKAEDNLSYATIYSPIDGIVTKINTEVGELAVTGTMNNPGTVILEVADLSRMLLVAQVDESDVGAVQVGQKAKVRIRAYLRKIFNGTVDSIALVADTQPEKHFRVEILLDTEGQRIYSGLSADVDIETKTHSKVLKVPSHAVIGKKLDDLPAEIRNDNPVVDTTKSIIPVVYVAKDGKAIVTPVTIGANDATHTVITAGLEEGAKIIVGPYTVLENIKHELKVIDEIEQLKIDKAKAKKEKAEKEKAEKAKKGKDTPDPSATQPKPDPDQ